MGASMRLFHEGGVKNVCLLEVSLGDDEFLMTDRSPKRLADSGGGDSRELSKGWASTLGFSY